MQTTQSLSSGRNGKLATQPDPQTDQNPVVVVYRRPMALSDRALQLFGAGEFTHCEIYLPRDRATFAIFVGCNMECSAVLSRYYTTRPDLFAWHMFVLNNKEYERLRVWNINQVYQHCPYNLKDLAWKIFPTAVQNIYVKDLSNDQAKTPKTMFCSQAVVLALRAACIGDGGSPHIEAFTKSMNSRVTTPTELANKTMKILGMELSSEPVPLTYTDAQNCIRKRMFGSVV
jgi:hypothetical protein